MAEPAKTTKPKPDPIAVIRDRVGRNEEDIRILADELSTRIGAPPETFGQALWANTKGAKFNTVKTHRVMAVAGGVAAWRLLARILESRTTLPVGLLSDIISGSVALLATEGGLILGKSLSDIYLTGDVE